jgi:hypothetical protein
LFPHRRWLHLYHCYSERTRHMGPENFAELCFECDCWFNNKGEWTEHLTKHLETLTDLLRCDPLIFRNVPVKAGYCPFCLGKTHDEPCQRMRQFTDPVKWYDHIDAHLANIKDNNYTCRHLHARPALKCLGISIIIYGMSTTGDLGEERSGVSLENWINVSNILSFAFSFFFA